MPDPDRLLVTIRQAVCHFRATPGRRGRFIQLDDAREVFATGDLHGNVENFRAILQRAELGRHPHRHLVLQELVHGRSVYGDGGDKSHQVVDLLAALKCQFPRQVHMLLGNHELAECTGRKVTKSDRDLHVLFRQGLAFAYKERADEIYAAYLALFAVVPLALRTANRVYLSHSLPRPTHLETFDPAVLEQDTHEDKDRNPGGAIYELVWGRDTTSATAAAFLAKVDADLLITGHIPCGGGSTVPNDRQLILDSLGEPAGYCLFPTDRPLSQAELLAGVGTL